MTPAPTLLRGAFADTYLTDVEKTVLAFVAMGHMNKEIAVKLGAKPKTIEAHREHLGRKLDARNGADLTRRAVELGVIELEVRPLRAVQAAGGRVRHMLPI